jgi:hypothetical protein
VLVAVTGVLGMAVSVVDVIHVAYSGDTEQAIEMSGHALTILIDGVQRRTRAAPVLFRRDPPCAGRSEFATYDRGDLTAQVGSPDRYRRDRMTDRLQGGSPASVASSVSGEQRDAGFYPATLLIERMPPLLLLSGRRSTRRAAPAPATARRCNGIAAALVLQKLRLQRRDLRLVHGFKNQFCTRPPQGTPACCPAPVRPGPEPFATLVEVALGRQTRFRAGHLDDAGRRDDGRLIHEYAPV